MKMNFKYKTISLLMIFLFCLTTINFKISATPYNVNVVVVGDNGVGKTTLINKLCTYGEDFKKVGNHSSIYYFSEQENQDYIINFYEIESPLEDLENLPFQSSVDILLRASNIAMIVFDLSEGNTLSKGRIQRYKEVVKTKSPQNLAIFIPNKIDLFPNKEERQKFGMPIADYAVQCEREQKYGCKNQDMECLPVSAISNVNIERLINNICEKAPPRIWAFEEENKSYYSLDDNIMGNNETKKELERKELMLKKESIIDKFLKQFFCCRV